MQQVNVDGLNFEFPDAWKLGKYDDWLFYRNRFSRVLNGLKALDLLAVCPARTAWLIEVKDYRFHQRTKPSELSDEIAKKVLDTLAAMLPARINARDDGERKLSDAVSKAKKLRIILHLEQPGKHSRLRPRAIEPDKVQLQLRAKLKPIDAHPLVVERKNMFGLAWTVQ
jgi:hypothetical protein